MMRNKTGLVVEGGGMKCAYEAGVLDGFLEDRIQFDYCIGVSAGSANIASFLAGQKKRTFRFYVDHIKEPGYFGVSSFIKTGNLFGLQYIYGTLTNSDGADPLDFDAMMQNPSQFEIVATNARTGKPVYFSKQNMRRNDYREIMASCAIPVVCRPVKFNGERYYDGGITDAIPVQRAMEQGCERLVIILSKNRNFVRTPERHRLLYHIACRSTPATIQAIDHRHIMYRQCQEKMFQLEREGKAFIFACSQPMNIGTYTMSKEANAALYEQGMQDYLAQRDALQSFLHHQE